MGKSFLFLEKIGNGWGIKSKQLHVNRSDFWTVASRPQLPLSPVFATLKIKKLNKALIYIQIIPRTFQFSNLVKSPHFCHFG